MYSCAFHEFPPFGADWYHQSIYQVLFNRNTNRNVGISYSLQDYKREFLVIPDEPGMQPYYQSIGEKINKLSYFYQFRIKSRVQCLASVTRVDINSEAIADDGVINLHSSSANQLAITVGYNVNNRKVKGWVYSIQPCLGFGTTFYSTNTFYSKIGWLKYQWNKVSPRIIAGSDKCNFTGGINGILEKRNFKIYLSASSRFFKPDKQGFQYGRETNLFMLSGYNFNSARANVQFEPLAGISYEGAKTDSQEGLSHKESLVFAGGRSLLACFAFNLRVRQMTFNCMYFMPISDTGFPEFQFYNKVRIQAGLQYMFE